MKKVLAIVLAIVFVFSCFSIIAGASAEVKYIWGENNTLTISGDGAVSSVPPVFYEVKSIIFEEGITEITVGGFKNLKNLTDISIPSTLTKIGSQSFVGCPLLSNIEVNEHNEVFDSRDNCNAIIQDCGLILGGTKTKIPQGVKWIGMYAFAGRDIEFIEIPNGVEEIQSKAFEGCSRLVEVIIPEDVTVGGGAFSGPLKSISFSESDSNRGGYIDYWAFSCCVETLLIPSGVEMWFESAFHSSDLRYVSMNVGNHLEFFDNSFCSLWGPTIYLIGDNASLSNINLYGEGYYYQNAEVLKNIKVCDHNHTFNDEEVLDSISVETKSDIPPYFQTVYTKIRYVCTLHKCTECDFYYKDNYKKVVAEDVVVESTCLGEGVSEFTTQNLSTGEEKRIRVTVPKQTHCSYDDVVFEPTCVSSGYTAIACIWCKKISEIDEFSYVKPTGIHTYELTTTTSSTYYNTGKHIYTCKDCNKIKEETIDMLSCFVGDVDNDNAITVADARLTLRTAIKLDSHEQISREYRACDYDGDNNITVNDARSILRKAVDLE